MISIFDTTVYIQFILQFFPHCSIFFNHWLIQSLIHVLFKQRRHGFCQNLINQKICTKIKFYNVIIFDISTWSATIRLLHTLLAFWNNCNKMIKNVFKKYNTNSSIAFNPFLTDYTRANRITFLSLEIFD